MSSPVTSLIHFRLRSRRIPQGTCTFSDWMHRHTTATGALNTRAVRKVRGTAMTHWQLRSMMRPCGVAARPKQAGDVGDVKGLQRQHEEIYDAHGDGDLQRQPSKWNRG